MGCKNNFTIFAIVLIADSMEEKLIKLPFGSELSPDVIQLPILLDICKKNSESKVDIESAILNQYFSKSSNGDKKNQKTLAMNCRLSLQKYLLLDQDYKLTEVGEKFYKLSDSKSLYKEFAKHILLNLNGMVFVQCIREMHMASEKVDLTTLRAGLMMRNISYPSGGKHPSIMRLWLAKAGIFIGKSWNINEEVIKDVLGLEDKAGALSELNEMQKAFLKTIINTGISDFQTTSNIVKLAESVYGIRFPEKNLPKLILNKLVDSDFIEAVKTTDGRGAKPFKVRLKPGLDPNILYPILEQLKNSVDPKLHQLMLKSISDIMAEIESKDTFTSGLALEALAFKLMRIIDMDYMATRLRGEATGGAEVDLIFQSSRLVYSRWQIQCKNTSIVSLDPIAKEVGLTHFIKSNVIVVVTTGRFSAEARRYSNAIMKDSNLCIILVDKQDILKISREPSNIIDIFNREAKHTMELKKITI